MNILSKPCKSYFQKQFCTNGKGGYHQVGTYVMMNKTYDYFLQNNIEPSPYDMASFCS